MSNCKSGLGLAMFKLDLNDREAVIKSLWEVLEADGDLVENEDYYRDDTLELGYEDEAARLVDEATKGKTFNTLKKFKKIFQEVFDNISGQEFFGGCECSFEDLGDGNIMVAYAYGGHLGW